MELRAKQVQENNWFVWARIPVNPHSAYSCGSSCSKAVYRSRRAEKRAEWTSCFNGTWGKLHRADPQLFPAEKAILNSAIFKASPFHRLGDDQLKAEQLVLNRVQDILATPAEVGCPHLMLIEGAAGTGKTVLISHLFLQISMLDTLADPLGERKTPSAELIVNHREQLTVYNSIMRRLGLQRRDDKVVSMFRLPARASRREARAPRCADRRFPCQPRRSSRRCACRGDAPHPCGDSAI